MEKHINKKLLTGVLALSCAFVLGACDSIDTNPVNYNDPILVDKDGNPVDSKDNILGKIYDAIAGNKNDKVVQKLLDEIAYKKYGSYTDIMNAKQDPTEYLSKHDAFKSDKDTAENAAANQKARFEEFANDIDERVNEAFYNLIVSGSYVDKDGKFDEHKLYDHIVEELWDVKEIADENDFKNFYVTNDLKKETALNESLNKDLYSCEDKPRGYIEKKIFPQIIKDKLVEEHIFKENYNTLGRSYARSINYVKVSYTSESLNFTRSLLNDFSTQFIKNPSAAYDRTANPEKEKLDFTVIDSTIRGFEHISTGSVLLPYGDYGLFTTEAPFNFLLTAEVYDKSARRPGEEYIPFSGSVNNCILVNPKANAKYFTLNDGTQILDTSLEEVKVFKNTKLGSLLDSYNKAIKAQEAGIYKATTEDSTELDKFKSDKTLAETLKDKIIDLAKQDNTFDGWVVKNGGASELPSELKDRLFNINVANDLDRKVEGDKYYYVNETEGHFGDYRYGSDGKELLRTPYVRRIYDRKFIMAANATAYDFAIDGNNFIYQADGTFYILQVLEAPSTPKLDLEATDSPYAGIAKENIAHQIAKVLATKDTYITAAYTKYFEKYDFVFSDTSLYEYFKGQYPDLFDDED